MLTATAPGWVVYSAPWDGGPRGVCTQAEWDRIEQDRPRYYTLVRAGFRTEAEAERFGRGSAGASRVHPFNVGRFGGVSDEEEDEAEDEAEAAAGEPAV